MKYYYYRTEFGMLFGYETVCDDNWCYLCKGGNIVVTVTHAYDKSDKTMNPYHSTRHITHHWPLFAPHIGEISDADLLAYEVMGA